MTAMIVYVILLSININTVNRTKIMQRAAVRNRYDREIITKHLERIRNDVFGKWCLKSVFEQ